MRNLMLHSEAYRAGALLPAVFLLAMLLLLGVAQSPQAQDNKPVAQKPPSPSVARETPPEELFRGLFPHASSDLAREEEPVFYWCLAMSEMMGRFETLAELRKGLSQKGDRVQAMRPRPGHDRDTVFIPGARDGMRSAVLDMHTVQNRIDAEQEALQKIAQRVVERAADIRAQMIALAEQEPAEPADATETKPSGDEGARPRILAHFREEWRNAIIEALAGVEEDKEAGAERILREVQRLVRFRQMRKQGPIQMHFGDQVERLEREQSILSQRLDANKRELEEIKKQIERMNESRPWRRPSGETATPGDSPAVEPPAPESGQPVESHSDPKPKQ